MVSFMSLNHELIQLEASLPHISKNFDVSSLKRLKNSTDKFFNRLMSSKLDPGIISTFSTRASNVFISITEQITRIDGIHKTLKLEEELKAILHILAISQVPPEDLEQRFTSLETGTRALTNASYSGCLNKIADLKSGVDAALKTLELKQRVDRVKGDFLSKQITSEAANEQIAQLRGIAEKLLLIDYVPKVLTELHESLTTLHFKDAEAEVVPPNPLRAGPVEEHSPVVVARESRIEPAPRAKYFSLLRQLQNPSFVGALKGRSFEKSVALP